jgi:hypothetical protein
MRPDLQGQHLPVIAGLLLFDKGEPRVPTWPFAGIGMPLTDNRIATIFPEK